MRICSAWQKMKWNVVQFRKSVFGAKQDKDNSWWDDKVATAGFSKGIKKSAVGDANRRGDSFVA